MTQPDDESLRQAFRSMARHDARRTPEFHALLARSSARPTWHKIVPAAAALALAASVLFGLRATQEERAESSAAFNAAAPVAAVAPAATAAPVAPAAHEEVQARLAFAEPAPLDFLLTLPGAAALGSVPTFSSYDSYPLPGRSR